MRRLLLLAVGCCAGALAQALTFDWEGAQSVTLSRDGTTGCYTGSGFDAVDGTRDFAIRLTLNFQAQGDADWFNTNGNTKTLLTLGDGRQDFTLYVNATAASAYRTWSRGDGSQDVSGERLIMALENVFIFAYDDLARLAACAGRLEELLERLEDAERLRTDLAAAIRPRKVREEA